MAGTTQEATPLATWVGEEEAAPGTSGATPLRLVVVNPADNTTFDLPEVPAEMTPAQLVEELIRQGHLPPGPDGRGYLVSVRGGHDLDPGQSLAAGRVADGATLQLFTHTPGAAIQAVHRERLSGDHAEMSNIRCRWIDWVGNAAMPPERYVVTYRLPSYVDAAFTKRDEHRVQFVLPAPYPTVPPAVRMLDQPPVYHPNIYADGRICTGLWHPEEGLAFMVIRVARMLLYQPAVTNPSSAASREAAQWYAMHPERFPLSRHVTFPDPLTGIHVGDPRWVTVTVRMPVRRGAVPTA
jgi:hypothetical protein